MRPYKNKKRIDPRYFLDETIDRVDEVEQQETPSYAETRATTVPAKKVIPSEKKQDLPPTPSEEGVGVTVTRTPPPASHSYEAPPESKSSIRYYDAAGKEYTEGDFDPKTGSRKINYVNKESKQHLKNRLKEIIQEEIALLFEGTIPFEAVLKMSPNLPRGYAVILGKQFENTPDGRAELKRALQDGSWKRLI